MWRWQSFALEAHERTISQLQTRLRDQAACQALLASAGGAGATAGSDERVGRKEMQVVVEKMERVISTLQNEKASASAKHVSPSPSALAHDAHACTWTLCTCTCACLARRHVEHAKTLKEIEMTNEELVEENSELRAKVVDADAARFAAEAALSRAEKMLVGGSVGVGDTSGCRRSDTRRVGQQALFNEQIEAQLRAARSESQALRDELVAKGQLLVDIGTQLTEAIDRAAASEVKSAGLEDELAACRYVTEVHSQVEAERDELRDAVRRLRSDHENLVRGSAASDGGR